MIAPMSTKRHLSLNIHQAALIIYKRRLFYAKCRHFFGFGSAIEVVLRRALVHKVERRIETLSAVPKQKRETFKEAV